MTRIIEYDHLKGPKFYFRDRDARDEFYRKVRGPWPTISFLGYISGVAMEEGEIILRYVKDLSKEQVADEAGRDTVAFAQFSPQT